MAIDGVVCWPHIAAMEHDLTDIFARSLPVVVAVALLLDAVFGDFGWLFGRIGHPVVWIGRLISVLEQALNRPDLSDRARFWRGMVASLVVISAAALFGLGVEILARQGGYFWLVEAFLLAVLVAQNGLYVHVRAVARALRRDGLAGGRHAVSMIVGRNPETLDRAGVCRAAIESCAENFSDGVVAPLFWFVLGGPVGLCAYKAINTLDSMIGHRNDRYLYFGRFAARLDDVANLVPARLAGMVICAAALPLGWAQGCGAWRVMWRDARNHKSPNAGWQEAAFAGALDLMLAGPRQYGDEIVNDRPIGEGRRDADIGDIDRALGLYIRACVVNIVVLLAGYGLWSAL